MTTTLALGETRCDALGQVTPAHDVERETDSTRPAVPRNVDLDGRGRSDTDRALTWEGDVDATPSCPRVTLAQKAR